MNKIIFALILIIGSIQLNAQITAEKLVPKPVLDAYAKDFPGVKQIRWEKKAWKPKAHYEAVLDYNTMRTRARYTEDGIPMWVSHYYKAAKIPAGVSSYTLAQFQGFKVDWGIQIKNFTNKTDRFWLRLSKPGHILKVLVNTADGKPIDDQNAMQEAPGDNEE